MELIKNQKYTLINKHGIKTKAIYQGTAKGQYEFTLENGFAGGKIRLSSDEFTVKEVKQ